MNHIPTVPLHRISFGAPRSSGAIAVSLLLALSPVGRLSAQEFSGTYSLAGGGNDVSSFAYNGDAITNLTPGALLKVGVTSGSSSGNFRASNWPTGATNASDTFSGSLNPTKYIEFTLTAGGGKLIDSPTITFGVGRSGTGPRQWEWRSSVDNYASPLEVTTVASGLSHSSGVLTAPDSNSSWTGNLIETSGTSFEGLSSITFRLYGYNSESTSGTGGLQGNLTFGGVLSSALGSLEVVVTPAGFSESASNPAASGMVTRTGDLSEAVTVNLSSGDTSEATVSPSSVEILANEDSAEFTVLAVDDDLPDGDVMVDIVASAAGLGTGTFQITVQDDGDLPPVVISQYYEGSSTNRYIELHNPNEDPITLVGYVLTAWNNAAAESWKTSGGTPNSQISLDSVTVPGEGYYLIRAPGATAPLYAVSGADLSDPAVVAGINGNDSIVLYNSSVFSTANIVDAVSFTNAGNEGLDTSFYRLTNAVGFSLAPGSNVESFPAVWEEKTVAQVDSSSGTDPWYLRGTVLLESLSLAIEPSSLLENSTTPATATVSRTGPTDEALEISILVNDGTEASAPSTVTIAATESTATFHVNAVDDSVVDGDKTVTVTVSAAGYISGSDTILIQDDGGDPPAFSDLVINEVDSDTPDVDTLEFVELSNKTSLPQSLNGLVLVFYNGGDVSSYKAIDLSGHTIPGNGYFVVGNPGVANVDISFPDGELQNGADAVALYAVEIDQFPNGTMVTEAPGTLIDAVVYDTNDADNTLLISTLTPGKPQVDESANSNPANESISRVPDGGQAFDTTVYIAQAPTPGTTNSGGGGSGFAAWIDDFYPGSEDPLIIGFDADPDGDGIPSGVEAVFGSAPDVADGSPYSEVAKDGNTFSFVYPRDVSPVAGLTVSYVWSTDAENWQASDESFGGVTVTISDLLWDDSDPEVELYQVNAGITAGSAPKLFVRVVVNEP